MSFLGTTRNQARPTAGNNVMSQNGNGGQYQIPHVPMHPCNPSQQGMGTYPPSIMFQSGHYPNGLYPGQQGGCRAPAPNPSFPQQIPPGYQQQQNFIYPHVYGPPVYNNYSSTISAEMQTPTPAEKKIILITDPKTKEVVNVDVLKAKAVKASDLSADQRVNTGKNWRDAVKAKMDEKLIEKDDLTVAQTVDDVEAKTSVSSNSVETKVVQTPLVEIDDVNKNMAQTVDLFTSRDELKDLPTREQDSEDRVPQISVTSLDKENAVEKASEAMVLPPKTPDVVVEEDPATVGTITTSSALVDNTEADVEEENEDETPEKDQAAKESERNLLREAELVAQMKTLEVQEKENIERNVYSRKFLSSICIIEKEIKWTPCPLTEDQLKLLGVDKSSAQTRDTNKNTRESFKTKWMTSNPTKPYTGGRGSMDSSIRHPFNKSYNPRKSHVSRPSMEKHIERAAPLRKAENAWKPDSKVQDAIDGANRKKQALKDVRALMNKVTPTTQKELTQELLRLKVSNDPDVLKDVIEIIFDKAVEEPKFCPLYSEMCKAQVNEETQSARGNQSLFRNAILTRAQQTFTNSTAEDEARIAKVHAIDAETDEQKKAQLTLSLQEYDAKIRRRKFGNITFIGQLYSQQLLSHAIVSSCMMTLLREANVAGESFTPEIEEAIYCSIRLLESVGPKMESEGKSQEKHQHPQEQQGQGKSQGMGQTKQPSQRPSLDQFMSHLDELKKKASPRLRFMIMNLQELRLHRWQKRKNIDQGPKKLDDLNKEIEQEQNENQMARDKHDQMRGTSSVGYRSDPKKNMYGERNALNVKTTSNVWSNRANTTSLSRSEAPLPQNKPLSQLSNPINSLGSVRSWKQGASGGHANLERKSSIPQGRGSREATEPLNMPLGSQKDEPLKLTTNEEEAVKSINDRIEAFTDGAFPIDSCPGMLLDIANVCNISIRSLFKSFAATILRKWRKDLKPSGHILAYFLQSDELKKQMKNESEAAHGFADFCKLVIAEEYFEDCPDIWKGLAEMIINAVQCELSVFTGSRPQIEYFEQAFIEASKDPREDRPFELLVLVLRKMVEINKRLDEKHYESMTEMAYEEIKFIKQLSPDQSNTLKNALKAQENIEGAGNLYDLLMGTS